jgi:hypothetical protein
MDKKFNSKYSMNARTKLAVLFVTIVVAAGLAGWALGHSNTSKGNQSGSVAQSTTGGSTNGIAVKSLVSYTLPDAWSEKTCSAVVGTVYVVPNGATLDCTANPSSPIKMFVDSGNTTDCQQLKPANTQNIKKHVCISLYINGSKSLKASTTYSAGSSYRTETTISDYYINVGNDVVVVEYIYTSVNGFQLGFDQLANSVMIKN